MIDYQRFEAIRYCEAFFAFFLLNPCISRFFFVPLYLEIRTISPGSIRQKNRAAEQKRMLPKSPHASRYLYLSRTQASISCIFKISRQLSYKKIVDFEPFARARKGK
jgi:hypothetical protein